MSPTLASLFAFTAFLHSCQSIRKKWIPNTNWNNPENWNNNVIPCSADTVRFDDLSPPYYVLVDDQVVVKEIIISPSSQLLIGDGDGIFFTNDTECDITVRHQDTPRRGQSTEFVGGAAKDWYDPNNWLPISDVKGKPSVSLGDRGVGLSRLPCEHDDVIFPSETFFSVFVDKSVTVRSFQLQGSSMSTQTLLSFLKTAAGRRQFALLNTATVAVSGQDCPDVAGCRCGNHVAEDEVNFCEKYQAAHCPAVTCSYPFTPPESCCHLCGHAVQFHLEEVKLSTFNYTRFSDQANLIIGTYVNTTGVFTRHDLDNGGVIYTVYFWTTPALEQKGETVAEEIRRILLDSSGQFQLEAINVVIQSSSSPINQGFIQQPQPDTPAPTQGGDGGLTSTTIYVISGCVAGALVIVLIIIILVLAITKRSRKQEIKGSYFNDPGAATFNASDQTATLEGFQNPIYSNPDEPMENPIYDEGHMAKTNPLYSSTEYMKPDEID